MNIKNKNGLSFIELLAIIAIISILFVLLIPQISKSIEKSKEVGILTDFRVYNLAFKSYFFDSMHEEKTIEGINKYLEGDYKFDRSNYSSSYRKSPFGSKYLFEKENDFKLRVVHPDNKKKVYFEIFLDGGELITRTVGLRNNIIASQFVNKVDGSFEYYIRYDNTISITKYLGNETNVNIPPTIEGLPVTKIDDHAFSRSRFNGYPEKRKLLTVNFPDSITHIGYYAFLNNRITQLNLPKNLLIVERGAFEKNGLSSVNFNENLTHIGAASFADNALTEVNLPKKLNFIGIYAFNRNSISNLTFSDSLTKISYGAFQNNNFTSISIPPHVELVESLAFYKNPLTTYSHSNHTKIEKRVFPDDSVRIH